MPAWPLAFRCAQRHRKEVLAGAQHRDYIIKEGITGGKTLEPESKSLKRKERETGIEPATSSLGN